MFHKNTTVNTFNLHTCMREMVTGCYIDLVTES